MHDIVRAVLHCLFFSFCSIIFFIWRIFEDEEIFFLEYENYSVQYQRKCRLRCLINEKSEKGEKWNLIKTKREILSDDQRAASIIAPHVIINKESKSQFAVFFINAPAGSIQFDNLTIKNLNDSNFPSSSSARSFQSNKELSDYLNECAHDKSNKIQITGKLCGDLYYHAQLSHLSNITFTFECSLAPSTINDEDYVMELTKSARGSDIKNNLTRDIYDGELKRHRSSQAMFRAREEKKLTTEQPALQWNQREQSIDQRFNDLTPEQLAANEAEYQQLIARCDQHDAEVKQRWLDKVHQNSPDIRPVTISVDDNSVKITASLKLTANDTIGIPLMEQFLKRLIVMIPP